MIPNRESSATDSNSQLRQSKAGKKQGNADWLASHDLTEGVLLLGGTSLADFRQRVAQSGLRGDLSPSYWSLCGLLIDDGRRFLSVPLRVGDVSRVPATNAIAECDIADYDDPGDWPNIGVVRFASDMSAIARQARIVAQRRTIVDLPGLVLAWLGYTWSVTGRPNPLMDSLGIPSAVFVETAHALAGVELTPGLASAASCPEAIWQAAKWWYEYYEEAPTPVKGSRSAGPISPQGHYALRQPSAQLADGG
jgi:hypothetical protein